MCQARTQSVASSRAEGRAPRIFISYSRNDSDWVRELRRAGDRSSGLELYSFPYEEAFGDDWQQTFRRLMQAADGLVCLVRATTSQNENIAWELDEATRSGIPILLAGRDARALADRRGDAGIHTIENSSPDQVVARLRELV
jgi:hypothetical protein